MASSINASTSPAAIVQTADGTGILALQTAGTTAVTVDASQNVGIGTASPAYKLDIVSNVNAISGQRIYNSKEQKINFKEILLKRTTHLVSNIGCKLSLWQF
jgi:hypothetical protein